jgi:DNA-binding transcriptional ArsR family regulator
VGSETLATDGAAAKIDGNYLRGLKSLNATLTQFLLFFGLVLGLPGAVFGLSKKYVEDDWRIALALAMITAAIPFFGFVLPAWLKRRRAKQATALGISGTVKEHDYFRLTPRTDSASFDRADRAPLLYLTGASGVGKSSIVEAWLLPKLREKGERHIIQARVGAQPVAAIREALLAPGAVWSRPPADELRTRELLERAAKKVAPKRLLLVLDQFEDALGELLRELQQHPAQDFAALLIFRIDYKVFVEEIGLAAFVEHENWEDIAPFTERAAIEFLRGSGLSLSAEQENQIKQEASEVEETTGTLRPITINMFGLLLTRHINSLPKGYKPGALLRSHLRSVIERKELRDAAPALLRQMITPQGTKQSISVTELAEKVSLSPAQTRGHLVKLSDEGLVRELDRGPNGEIGQGVWEISHDFIAKLYDRILAGWRDTLWQRARPWLAGSTLSLWLVALLATLGTYITGVESDATKQIQRLGFFLQAENGILNASAQGRTSVANSDLVAAVPYLLKIKSLQTLDISVTTVNDLAPLANLTTLRGLNLWTKQVNDLTPLAKLTSLQSLDLSYTRVNDLQPLVSLTELRDLNLSGTQVRDLLPLAKLIALQTLDLSFTKVNNVKPLEKLDSLKSLDLASTHVTNLAPLQMLTDLQSLNLSGTQVTKLDPLQNLTALQSLDLSRTKITNLNPLAKLSKLKFLFISNSITIASELETLKRRLPNLEISVAP